MPCCPTFKKHCKNCANRQSPAPGRSSIPCILQKWPPESRFRKGGPPLCQNIAHTAFSSLFHGFLWGRAAGDAFFRLLGFRCDPRGGARRTQAGTHALKLGWVSACSVSGRLGKQPCSVSRVWVRSERVLGWARGVWICGRHGWVGGMCRHEQVRRSGSQTRSRLNRVLLSAPHLTCPTGQRSW